MNKYIVTNYYSDTNPERREELLFCVQKNLNLSFITNVIVFLDNLSDLDDLKKLNNFSKLVFIDLKNKNLLSRTIVDYCDKILPKNSVVILINLDIFLEDSESWKTIDKNFF
jgi:hypothetical protein